MVDAMDVDGNGGGHGHGSGDGDGRRLPVGATMPVTVEAADGVKMTIDRQCAAMMETVRPILMSSANASSTAVIPLSAVKSTTLGKIIEYLEQHKDEEPLVQGNKSAKGRLVKRSPSKSLGPDGADNGNANTNDDDDDDDEGTIANGAEHSEADSTYSSSSDEEYLYEEYLSHVSPWDQRFMESMDLPALIELTKAVNYLSIPRLLDLCCRSIAKQMTGLKTEELRKKFNLPNDFTPEEEAKLASEFAWVEE